MNYKDCVEQCIVCKSYEDPEIFMTLTDKGYVCDNCIDTFSSDACFDDNDEQDYIFTEIVD